MAEPGTSARSPGRLRQRLHPGSFCAATTCAITTIYDQSGHGNNLTYQGPGGVKGGKDIPTSATSESFTVAGKKVYSLYLNLGNGYWHDGSSSGMPKGSSPQGIYMVTSGTHVNNVAASTTATARTDRKTDKAADGCHLLWYQLLVRRMHRNRPLGGGRPRMGTVPRRKPHLEPQPACFPQPICHCYAQE